MSDFFARNRQSRRVFIVVAVHDMTAFVPITFEPPVGGPEGSFVAKPISPSSKTGLAPAVASIPPVEDAPALVIELAPPVSDDVAPPVSVDVAPPVSDDVAPPESVDVAPPESVDVAPPVSTIEELSFVTFEPPEPLLAGVGLEPDEPQATAQGSTNPSTA